MSKALANVTSVPSMLKSNSVLIEIGGAVRRISMENFRAAMNEGQYELLNLVAWGFPLEKTSSPAWGMVGNTAAWQAYKAKIGRYLMTPDGRAAKLNPSNSAIYADGTTLDEGEGSVVVIAPRLYYLILIDAETNIPYLWLSEHPISSHYFGNADNGNRIVVAAFKGSMVGGKLVSRSGGSFDTSGKTITQYWNAAQSFGSNWGLIDYDFIRWFEILCLSEANGNANIQNSLGQGVGGSSGYPWGSSIPKTPGATRTLGDATGTVSISGLGTNSCHVSVRGIEDMWNLQWEFVQGLYFGNSGNAGQSGAEVFIYTGNRLPSSSELSYQPSGSFRQLTRLSSSGYASALIKGEYFDVIASALSGNSNSYWCDYFNGGSTGQVCIVGGVAENGSWSGPLAISTSVAWSGSDSSIGARPAYYGPVTIVDGKNI